MPEGEIQSSPKILKVNKSQLRAAEARRQHEVGAYRYALEKEHPQSVAVLVEIEQNLREKIDGKNNDTNSFLQKLDELSEEEQELIWQDPSLQYLGQEYVFHSLRIFSKDKNTWKVEFAARVAKALHSPKAFEKTETTLEFIKDSILNLSEKNIKSLLRLVDVIEIPPEILSQSEVQDTLLKSLVVTSLHVSVEETAEYLHLFLSPDRQAQFISERIRKIDSNYSVSEDVGKLQVLMAIMHDVPEDVMHDAVKLGVKLNIQNTKVQWGEAEVMSPLAKGLGITTELQEDQEIAKVAQEKSVSLLRNHFTIQIFEDFADFFQFNESFIGSPGVQSAIAEGLRKSFSNVDILGGRVDSNSLRKWYAFCQKYQFNMDYAQDIVLNAINQSSRVSGDTEDKYARQQSYQHVWLLANSQFLHDKQLLQDPTLQDTLEKGIIAGKELVISVFDSQELTHLLLDFPLNEDVIVEPEVQKMLLSLFEAHFKDGVYQCYHDSHRAIAEALLEKFHLDAEPVKDIVTRSLVNNLQDCYQFISWSQELAELSDGEMHKAVGEGLRICADHARESSPLRDQPSADNRYFLDEDYVLKEMQPVIPAGAFAAAFTSSLEHGDHLSQCEFFFESLQKGSLVDKTVKSPETQSAYQTWILAQMEKGDIDAVKKLLAKKSSFQVNTEMLLENEEIRSLVKAEFIRLLRENTLLSAKFFTDMFGFQPGPIEDPEAQGVIKAELVKKLQNKGTYNDYKSFLTLFCEYPLPTEAYQCDELLSKSKDMLTMLAAHESDLSSVEHLIQAMQLSPELVNEAMSEAIRRIVGFGSFSSDSDPTITKLTHLVERFPNLQSEVYIRGILKVCSFYESSGDEIIDKLGIPQDIAPLAEHSIFLRTLMENWHVTDLKSLRELLEDSVELWSLFAGNPDEALLLLPEERDVVKKLHLTYKEAERLKRSGVGFNDLQLQLEEADRLSKIERNKSEEIRNEVYTTLFNRLTGTDPKWQDLMSIVQPFEQGAAIFGHERMFAYMDVRFIVHDDGDESNVGAAMHDTLHSFHNIISLFDSSGIFPDQFYGNILNQVRMDESRYEEGTSVEHFNVLARTLNTDYQGTLAALQRYKYLDQLQELALVLSSSEAIFANWNNLKRYSQLQQILEQSVIFEQLRELKQQGNNKLYEYVSKLAFHPDSKVDMHAVMQFWQNPESFLDSDDDHAPTEIQNRKKPSNYINMPNLDLSATELRDALVEGDLDEIQTFSPFEIRYKIHDASPERETLNAAVSRALGSRKEGIVGVAKNSKKLFSELQKFLSPHGISVADFIASKKISEEMNLNSEIASLLYDENFGMKRPYKTSVYVAKISKKSDPEAVLAGDDTVNCMPFGSGKNTVYTYNPNTAQFVVRLVKGDGKERTIAQSVLTKDMDVGIAVPTIISELLQKGEHLANVLPEGILLDAPRYIAADNVEVAPNFSDPRKEALLTAIYKDFFREYVSRYGISQGLNADKLLIGQGFADSLQNLPEVNNTFVPQAPVSYSDKTGSNVYMLDLSSEDGTEIIAERTIILSPDDLHRSEPPLPGIRGIGYLTYEDALRVGFIEGKAYKDNKSLMEYLFNMENALIAKDINNAQKDRPNMSVKYTDTSGKMRGYLLAWEGVIADSGLAEESEELNRQQCVYVSDLATDKENSLAGGSLITSFTQLYKQNYLDKGILLPIYAQTRETTSYRIIQRQLERLGESIGIEFELIELPAYQVGSDTMHPLILKPGRNI